MIVSHRPLSKAYRLWCSPLLWFDPRRRNPHTHRVLSPLPLLIALTPLQKERKTHGGPGTRPRHRWGT